MPNQNDSANPTVPNTNPDPSAQGVNPTLTVDPTSTPPFGAVTEEVSTPFPPSGTAAPGNDIASQGPAPQPTTTSSVSSGGSGKGRGRLIATILGILFLVGGVVAGIILVQQQQEIRERAACNVAGAPCTATCPDGQVFRDDCPITFGSCSQWAIEALTHCSSGPAPAKTPTPAPGARNVPECGACSPGGAVECSSGTCCPCGKCGGVTKTCNQICSQNACSAAAQPTPAPAPGATPAPGTQPQWEYSNNCIRVNFGTVSIQRFNGTSCPTTANSQSPQSVGPGTYCPSPQGGSSTPCQQVDVVGSGQGVCACASGGGGGTPAPTPAFAASCVDVKAYDTSWNALTAAQLGQLSVGGKVRFTVLGTATSGVFDKALFTINGAQQPETLVKKPGTNEFYVEYTIPAGVTQFNIGAIVHHAGRNIWR